MRVVFMGTPEFAIPTLNWLIASEHQIVGVYTQPDKRAGRSRKLTPSPVKKKALRHSLAVFQPPTLRDPAEIGRLAEIKPDVIVVAAFGKVLPKEVLEIPSFGCLNLHPSILPKYRGASPVAGAILGGEKETGVAIMLLDEGLDTGPILAQSVISIDPQDTTELLTAKLAKEGAELLGRTLPLWLRGHLVPQPQNEKNATYTRQISHEDGRIDWHLPAIEIARQVRAFYLWPSSYTYWKGKRLKILEAFPLSEEKAEIGKVVVLNKVIGVGTGEGTLCVRKLQLEGKHALTAEEFSRGQRDISGTSLLA